MSVGQAVERLAMAVGRPVVDLLGGRGREPLTESGHPEYTESGIARDSVVPTRLVALGARPVPTASDGWSAGERGLSRLRRR